MGLPKLKFSKWNRKLQHLSNLLGLRRDEVTSFDLPCGYTCPKASICLAYSNKDTGKITRGKDSKFLCYGAKLEAAFKNLRLAHWHNYMTLLRTGDDYLAYAEIIERDLPPATRVCRIHSFGDFFSLEYFKAWCYLAHVNPYVQFFGYTKVFEYASNPDLPPNFKLVYSMGGKDDEYAWGSTIPQCFVVRDEKEAKDRDIPIACVDSTAPDDYYYIQRQESFGILLH